MAGIPFFIRPLPFTIAQSDNERSESPASNLGAFGSAGMTWRSNGAANLRIAGDLGAANPVNFVGMLAANALPGTTITVQLGSTLAAATGSSPEYSSGPQPFISPAPTTSPTFFNSHLEISSLPTMRYFQISIAGHTGDFEAPFLVMGQKLQGARYYEPEWESGPVDLSTVNITRTGVADIADGMIQRGIGFTLGWTTEAEYENLFAPFARLMGKTKPAYLCFDPDPSGFRQSRTYFGRFTDNLKTTKKAWNRFERQFTIQSLI